MSVLNFLRAKKKEEDKELPLPTPVAPEQQPLKSLPSDFPPIRGSAKHAAHETHEDHEPIMVLRADDHEPSGVKPESAQEVPADPSEPKHLFISSDEYAHILEKTNTIRAKLLSSEETVQKLSNLRDLQAQQLDVWQEELETIEKKITYVENVLGKNTEV